ncbi:long-chain fatty acid--CoA ligase [Nesterenkonia salmonea]|uniref:Long-chain fatty acid--CoA ligase n=1 Tax=Nesterenkonia salmonea TaxID=1804987 RepID=A0A5R9BKE4_9MICC|nr:long-chain fatty acid--CoA ligase [Nesterenkonia salmonea]TLQ01079.1 long-chain fatty acid--CoA ligase [Nesterenkonia salmonea]
MTKRPDEAIDGAGFATLSMANILSETARRFPERPALHFAGATVSYGDLWEETRAYAGALRDRGIGRGSRVAMIVPNVPDFPRVYFAVLSLGAVVVPIHLLFKAREIEYVLQDSEADLVVAAAPMLGEAVPATQAAGLPLLTVLQPSPEETDLPYQRLEEEAAAAEPLDRNVQVHPTDAATILYTSGTTGQPKGAVVSHVSGVEQVHCSLIDAFDLGPDDVVFGGLPLFHAFGQMAVMNMSFRCGASIILLPVFDPDEVLAQLDSYRATVFTAVPTMYVGMLEAAKRSGARPPLRYAVSGGAALPEPVLEEFSSVYGAQVHEGYGLTETAPTVSFNSIYQPIRPGTAGRPIWGVDVAVADPHQEDEIRLLAPGDLGELVVRGHNLMKGYLGRPEASQAAVQDGWFRTGDLGTVGEHDVVTIVDRKKDMIIRNGYNVYPTEVEAVLAGHPDVAMGSVFGVSHPAHGQEVHAAVVLEESSRVDPDSIVAYVKERVAAYKYPRVVHIVDELPMGPSGKIRKRELPEMFAPAQR